MNTGAFTYHNSRLLMQWDKSIRNPVAYEDEYPEAHDLRSTGWIIHFVNS